MISNLVKFIHGDSLIGKVKKIAIIKSGFESSVNVWDRISVSIDTKEIVIGHSDEYKDYIEVFINEKFFRSNEFFNIVVEDDINLSQKNNYYCYDKKIDWFGLK